MLWGCLSLAETGTLFNGSWWDELMGKDLNTKLEEKFLEATKDSRKSRPKLDLKICGRFENWCFWVPFIQSKRAWAILQRRTGNSWWAKSQKTSSPQYRVRGAESNTQISLQNWNCIDFFFSQRCESGKKYCSFVLCLNSLPLSLIKSVCFGPIYKMPQNTFISHCSVRTNSLL